MKRATLVTAAAIGLFLGLTYQPASGEDIPWDYFWDYIGYGSIYYDDNAHSYVWPSSTDGILDYDGDVKYFLTIATSRRTLHTVLQELADAFFFYQPSSLGMPFKIIGLPSRKSQNSAGMMSGWCIEGYLTDALGAGAVHWGLTDNNESGHLPMDFYQNSPGGPNSFNLLPKEKAADRPASKNLQQNQQVKDLLKMLAAKPSIEGVAFTLHDSWGMNYQVTSPVQVNFMTSFLFAKVYPQFKTKLGKGLLFFVEPENDLKITVFEDSNFYSYTFQTTWTGDESYGKIIMGAKWTAYGTYLSTGAYSPYSTNEDTYYHPAEK